MTLHIITTVTLHMLCDLPRSTCKSWTSSLHLPCVATVWAYAWVSPELSTCVLVGHQVCAGWPADALTRSDGTDCSSSTKKTIFLLYKTLLWNLQRFNTFRTSFTYQVCMELAINSTVAWLGAWQTEHDHGSMKVACGLKSSVNFTSSKIKGLISPSQFTRLLPQLQNSCGCAMNKTYEDWFSARSVSSWLLL